MAQDSDLEKTEQPSSKRIEQAREEGNVPRSRELATCTILLAAGLGIWVLGDRMNVALKNNLATSLTFEREMAFDPMLLLTHIATHCWDFLVAFAPLALLLFIVAIGSPVLIGGWNFSSQALIPKFSRLNPISGFSNIISKNGLIEFIKAIAKSALVGFVGYKVISYDFTTMISLTLVPLDAGIAQVAELLIKGFLYIVGSLVLIAAIDVPFQLKEYNDKLKMSKEEVRQESKESEGNPEVKARVRQQQREMARRRMMSEIPNADVVITNPTHYAVAIKYAEGTMRAPRVVAKGADAIALKIRQIAGENKVLTLESPKLARALFAHTELGDEIPEALYSAVAEILAYVFQIRIFNTQGGVYPNQPTNTVVPDELDPHYAESQLRTV